MPLWMIVYYFYTIIEGPFNFGGKSCRRNKKKKKKIYGAKITVSICLQDKRPKRGLGGCRQLGDIGVYIKCDK